MLCIYGYGFCKPEIELEINHHWQLFGLEFQPNLDNIFNLTLAAIVASITTFLLMICLWRRDAEPIYHIGPTLENDAPCKISSNYQKDSEDSFPQDHVPSTSQPHFKMSNVTSNSDRSCWKIWTGWFTWKKCSLNNDPKEIDSQNCFTSSCSIQKLREKTYVDRIPSSEIGEPIMPVRLTQRSLPELTACATTDPILIFHQLPLQFGLLNGQNGTFELETILRLCGIPHIIIHDSNPDIQPWLSYKGKDFFGLENCLEFLEKKYYEAFKIGKVPSERMVPSRYIKTLVESHLRCAVAYWRGDPEQEQGLEKEGFVLKNQCMKYNTEFQTKKKDEIFREIELDLEALEASLGNKDYFIGNSMTFLDCSVFAMLASFMWGIKEDNAQMALNQLIKKYPGLIRYCETIRKHLWDDWKTDVVTSPSMLLTCTTSSSTNVEYELHDNTKYDRVSEEEAVQGTFSYFNFSRLFSSRGEPQEQQPSFSPSPIPLVTEPVAG